MSPYVDFSYFLFLLYPLAILLVLGLLGRLGPRVILIVSIVFVIVQFIDPLGTAAQVADGLRQLTFLGAYVVLSLVIVLGFSAFRAHWRNRWVFYLAVAVALLPLIVVKVYPLALDHGWLIGPLATLFRSTPFGAVNSIGGANALAPGLVDTFGFLGISYMTFRTIDAIIVAQDGLIKEAPTFGSVASYLLFLPTISAGPIDRYRRFTEDAQSGPRSRQKYLRDVEIGIHRVAQGFLYKFILAYLIYRYALQPAANATGMLALLRYTYAYSFYLFFDFAGYSAFAIGVGHFFGIRVPENFDKPFLSRSFREVWNRWNITLSWWLRDHVYMRFMMKATRGKWFGGNRQLANYVGLFLTMGLMGFWHGLYLHYIVYGIYQGFMLVAYDVFGRWNRAKRLIPDGWLTHGASVFVTFNLFCFGLLIFSGHLFN